jgi:DNA-3-methyladenine glycosylase
VREPGLLIPTRFYLRPVAEVAKGLLGQLLSHGDVVMRITEVEAYGGPEDSASHCRFGRTARNAPMWESGGRAYVFLCYGAHHMLNVVTGDKDVGGAVLIRSCEPLEGLETIRIRRGGLTGVNSLAGPGKVAQALGLDLTFNNHLLYEPGGLVLLRGDDPEGILVGPRIGVDYAKPQDREAPLRFAVAGSASVTHPKHLRPFMP